MTAASMKLNVKKVKSEFNHKPASKQTPNPATSWAGRLQGSPLQHHSVTVGRKPLVCVLGLPSHMTYADFYQFCASFGQNISEMRIVRINGMKHQYSILLRFDSQGSTDKFYQHFNGRKFNSLEEGACRVHFTADIQNTSDILHLGTKPAPASSLASCPVCHEGLDQGTSGILKTICNHSFHCSCISRWTDSSCPVCRYCQQQPEKSICFVCQTSENLWMCVICGFVGCGRYEEGHARTHWEEKPKHCYFVNLKKQSLWNYACGNYVYRVIRSKTDVKLVELNSHCLHAEDNFRSHGCDSEAGDALLNCPVKAVNANRHNKTLATWLKKQELYYDGLVQEIKEETEKLTSEAVNKAISEKLQKIQSKLDRCVEEKKLLEWFNENLLENQEIWKAKIVEVEERENKALRVKDDRTLELEKKLAQLMADLEAEKTPEQLSISNEIEDGTILPISVEPSTSNGAKVGKKKRSKSKRRGGR
ncbi:BRAP2 RING ZnF UBP domain-containing protein 2-like [Pistacia vera]|uniref:BRAP2 RING ZnF UBP domain-containing protein 2-like n=1 Tax=Pistacia vera TaxID=55513 RepID=UPI001262C470|nr:BRAP2 RING ZnF UBP domain-containing protein 2-like [Pistacia vera]